MNFLSDDFYWTKTKNNGLLHSEFEYHIYLYLICIICLHYPPNIIQKFYYPLESFYAISACIALVSLQRLAIHIALPSGQINIQSISHRKCVWFYWVLFFIFLVIVSAPQCHINVFILGLIQQKQQYKAAKIQTVSLPSDHYNGNFFSGKNGVFILNQLQTFKVPSLTLGQFCDVPNSNSNTWLAHSMPFLFLQKLTEVNASIISSNYNLCSIFTIDRLYTPSCYTEQCFLYFRAWIVHLAISRK